MAYRSQGQRKNLSIAVPSIQVDATGCIDASPGRPVLDVSSPKALGSPTKQSLHQQRSCAATVFEAHQRRRRPCHGTLAEQHSPGWQLKQSWTLDSKQADVTSCSSSFTASQAADTSSNTTNQDAAGNSSKQDQQTPSTAGSAAETDAAAVPAGHVQAHQEAAADADFMDFMAQAARPPSPFAAPEVQACTCHVVVSKQACQVHAVAAVSAVPSKMVYTGSATTSSNGSSSSNSSTNSSTSNKAKMRNKLRTVAEALWEGMSLSCWHPSATVPGMGGAYMLRK